MDDWILEIAFHYPHDRFLVGWEMIEPDEQYNYFTFKLYLFCLLYTSPSPRDRQKSRMPSSA